MSKDTVDYCDVVAALTGEEIPKCKECKHYGCNAFRALKAEQERYEEVDYGED